MTKMDIFNRLYNIIYFSKEENMLKDLSSLAHDLLRDLEKEDPVVAERLRGLGVSKESVENSNDQA